MVGTCESLSGETKASHSDGQVMGSWRTRAPCIAAAVRCGAWFGGHPCTCGRVAGQQLRHRRDAHAQISQQPIANTIDPAMHRQYLTTLPGIADDCCARRPERQALTCNPNAAP